MKKITRHPLFQQALIGLAAVYTRLVFATARIHLVEPIPSIVKESPVVFALWHQQIAFTPVLMRQTYRPLFALMSASRDGTAIRLLAAKFGIQASIGSSHRGAYSGTRNLMRAAKEGNNIFLTPDGPRGPARKAKQGATEVSRLTRLPLVPCAAWSSRGKSFNSWDKFRLPYPFARITLAVGSPLEDATPHSLQQALNTLTAQAQEACGDLAPQTATN